MSAINDRPVVHDEVQHADSYRDLARYRQRAERMRSEAMTEMIRSGFQRLRAALRRPAAAKTFGQGRARV